MKHLSRRSFSKIVAAAGLIGGSSGLSVASDRIASEPNWDPGRNALGRENQTERWTPAQNESWRWYERESLRGGQWEVTGVTKPVHRETGRTIDDIPGYLDESLVPEQVRRTVVGHNLREQAVIGGQPPRPSDSFGKISMQRRARDGRPPSNWLRSMDSEELRDWLSTVDVGEAGVRGMTFWTHLTRDHLFKPLLIKGLTETEQAKLHAAAHFGY